MVEWQTAVTAMHGERVVGIAYSAGMKGFVQILLFVPGLYFGGRPDWKAAGRWRLSP